MPNDRAKDNSTPKAQGPWRSLRNAVFRLDRQVEREEETIARSNWRKTLLVVTLFLVVLIALLVAYLQLQTA